MSKKQVPSYLGAKKSKRNWSRFLSYQASTGSDEPDLAACLKVEGETMACHVLTNMNYVSIDVGLCINDAVVDVDDRKIYLVRSPDPLVSWGT